MTAQVRSQNWAREPSCPLRQRYYYRVPAEHTLEDVMEELYFGAITTGSLIQPGAVIECECENLEWSATLQVRIMDHNSGRMQTMIQHQWQAPAPQPQAFPIEWGGPQRRFVIHKPDGTEEAGHMTREAAELRARVLAGVSAETPKPARRAKAA